MIQSQDEVLNTGVNLVRMRWHQGDISHTGRLLSKVSLCFPFLSESCRDFKSFSFRLRCADMTVNKAVKVADELWVVPLGPTHFLTGCCHVLQGEHNPRMYYRLPLIAIRLLYRIKTEETSKDSVCVSLVSRALKHPRSIIQPSFYICTCLLLHLAHDLLKCR